MVCSHAKGCTIPAKLSGLPRKWRASQAYGTVNTRVWPMANPALRNDEWRIARRIQRSSDHTDFSLSRPHPSASAASSSPSFSASFACFVWFLAFLPHFSPFSLSFPPLLLLLLHILAGDPVVRFFVSAAHLLLPPFILLPSISLSLFLSSLSPSPARRSHCILGQSSHPILLISLPLDTLHPYIPYLPSRTLPLSPACLPLFTLSRITSRPLLWVPHHSLYTQLGSQDP